MRHNLTKHFLVLSITIFFITFLLTRTAFACLPPNCQPCYQWNGYNCEYVGCSPACTGCQECNDICNCVDDDDNCDECYNCNNGECESMWETGPEISDACIKKEHNQIWFHYTQSCALVAKGHDYDECNDEVQPDDYIDLSLTVWHGGIIDGATGESVLWAPEEPSSSVAGDSITATVKDNPDGPDAENPENTDDEDVVANSAQLIAYECVATLNWSSWQGVGYSGAAAICECGCCGSTEGQATISLSNGPISVETTVSEYEEKEFHDATFAVGPFGGAKWELTTNPNGANFAGGHLACQIDVSASGTLYCFVSDTDYDTQGLSADVSVSVGVGIASVSITPIIEVEEGQAECEGQAVLAFGFNSEILGNLVDPYAPKLTRSSGDGCDTYDQSFWYSFGSSQLFTTSVNGGDTEARAEIGGKVAAVGYVDTQCTGEGGCIDIPYNSESSMWTDGSVVYDVSVAEVVNPPLAGPESGYND